MSTIEGGKNAYETWQSHWTSYIETSKRASSSALITADNFIKRAKIARGARILDMGCGHGRITELIVQRVPDLDIVGVDMTQQLLDNFMAKTGVNGCKIQLLQGDITKLPFPDNAFDAIISSRVFQYVPDPVVGVSEAYRVLKPGGHAVIALPNRMNIVKYLTYKQAKLYSPFEARDWFEKSGFKDIVYDSMCFFPSTYGWKRTANFFEICNTIPFLKYTGGNVVASGAK